MTGTLDTRRAWVTGGGTGIGLACADALARAGAHVTVTGRRTEPLKASGHAFETLDVTDMKACEVFARAAGPFDIVVANAGNARTAPLHRTDEELWAAMIGVNLSGTFHTVRAGLPHMLERGWGRVICIGSTASLKGYRYCGAYAAAKHGVLGLVRSLALETAGQGVTANVLCPGFTDTALVQRSVEALTRTTDRSEDQARSALSASNPQGRLVSPEEVGALAAWLCEDAARGVNGQALAVDGGETA